VEPKKTAVKLTKAAVKPNNGVVRTAKAGRCNCLSSSLLLADESTSKAPIATNKAGPSGKADGKVRSPEYSSKDLLILAQSYIQVSENAIDGMAKKSSTFWEELAVTFNKLKQSQVDYDKHKSKRAKYHKILLKGEYLTSDSEEEEICNITSRMSSSLQQKWSNFVAICQ